jgi:hypothetical protein
VKLGFSCVVLSRHALVFGSPISPATLVSLAYIGISTGSAQGCDVRRDYSGVETSDLIAVSNSTALTSYIYVPRRRDRCICRVCIET